MENVIIVSNLKKTYGKNVAVDDVSFEVEKGSIFGLLGANGAGKTTTIECMVGTKKKDEGIVKILGLDPIKERKEVFKCVGVQFQDCAYPNLIKVNELCEMTACVYKNPASYCDLLEKFGLKDKIKNYVST